MSENGRSPSLRVFQGKFFTIGIPVDWEEVIVEDIPSFFDPDGAGAFQVVALSHEGDDYQLEDEMRRFLTSHGVEFDEAGVVSYVAPEGYHAMACEFRKEDRFWMVQMAATGKRLVIIMYNSDEVPDRALSLTLSGMIQSLKFN